MTGFWLVSYILLWALVVGLCVFLVGVLRQIGLLHLQIQQLQASAQIGRPSAEAEAESIPPLENDGPAIGAQLPGWALTLAQESGGESPMGVTASEGAPPARQHTLLMFMSPLCEVCQHVVDPLNALVADATRAVRPLVVIRADEQAYRAFLSVFPLHMLTLCDTDRELTMGLGVHRTPFGLLYDADGALVRKGLIESRDDLLALLNDPAAPAESRGRMYPPAGAEAAVPADMRARASSAEAPV